MLNEHSQAENPVVVFKAPEEYIADMLVGLLVNKGIPAFTQSLMVPWLDGIMMPNTGYWGNILVPEKYAELSKELIDQFLSASEEDEANCPSEE